ncbi:sialidase domain-containing protein [Clostridium sp.]|uniref:sialidase domain-containing protein n=1 Tax=Clostridium sp. TaxID=1506 RepID=UPI003F3AC0E7
MKNKKVIAGIISTLVISNISVPIQAIGNDNINKNPIIKSSDLQLKNEIVEENMILNNENIRINKSEDILNISDKLDQLKNLEQGTIIARFRSNDELDSLIGISNSTKNATHFHMYKSAGKVGVEIRDESKGINKHIYANVALNEGFNTMAFKVEKDKSYSIYLNGELVKEEQTNDTKFLSDIEGLNSAFIGKTPRSSGNQYEFRGDIDFINVYSNLISNEYLINKTSETKQPEEDDNLPEGAYKSEPIDLFAPGNLGSNNYRIPALYTTKDGTVLASIDARISNGGDSPNNIDTAIKRSEDGGKTWDEGQIILDYPDKASAIDTAMVQDKESGRIFLLVTHFASGYGFPNSKTGSGYKEIDGVRYLQLFDKSNNEYTVREEGKVYDSQGNVTNYVMNEDRDLFENNEKIDNVLTSTSPLKVLGTSYLSLIHSDDDGKTWSKPIDLNKDVKVDWMRFLGTGPGRGHQIENGKYAGRIVFPVYLTNKYGFQSSAVIYSDDNGENWKIGETATDGRDMGNGQIGNAETQQSGNQLTECQVVEMPNGQLKMFMRNTGSYVRIATSFDGGATWDDDVVEDTNLREPYCQLSVANYSQQVDGKDAILFSNPNASSRANGTVRVGLINQNGTYENGEPKYEFDWKYNKLVKNGYFAYSCLTELPNGNVGLFYEGTDNKEMSYTEMNLNYLKFNRNQDATAPKIEDVVVVNEKEYYNPNDEIQIKIKFDQNISIMGDRSIVIHINGKDMILNMSKYENAQEVIFTGNIPVDVKDGNYQLALKANENMEIINVFNKVYKLEIFETPINIQVGEPLQIQTPINIKVENISDIAAKISWEAPQNTRGLVEYNIYQNGKMIGTVNKDEELIFVANSLNPQTEYQFEVTSKYENGEESEKVLIDTTTTSALKLQQPKRLNASISGSSAIISWDVPDDITGIENYVIYVDGKKLQSVGKNENSYILKDLSSKGKYKVEVASGYLGGKESKTAKVNINMK